MLVDHLTLKNDLDLANIHNNLQILQKLLDQRFRQLSKKLFPEEIFLDRFHLIKDYRPFSI